LDKKWQKKKKKKKGMEIEAALCLAYLPTYLPIYLYAVLKDESNGYGYEYNMKVS
jgi:hypothetical protein